jgi:hypothetical protein
VQLSLSPAPVAASWTVLHGVVWWLAERTAQHSNPAYICSC